MSCCLHDHKYQNTIIVDISILDICRGGHQQHQSASALKSFSWSFSDFLALKRQCLRSNLNPKPDGWINMHSRAVLVEYDILATYIYVLWLVQRWNIPTPWVGCSIACYLQRQDMCHVRQCRQRCLDIGNPSRPRRKMWSAAFPSIQEYVDMFKPKSSVALCREQAVIH